MNFWSVVQTHSLSEKKAKTNLEQQGFDCYLPMLFSQKRVQPLFPRYLFVFVESEWRCVLGTVGVSKVLLDSDRPAKLPDGFVEALRSRENKKGLIQLPRDRYRKGERVRISGGLFEGQSGWYEGASKLDREIVLLDILGRVELASSDLF